MKKLVTLAIMLISQIGIFAEDLVTIDVEENVELVAILARLAGYEEYYHNMAGQYTTDIDEWFGKYNNHSAVQFMKKMRKENSIGYDRVAALGVSLECKKGKVQLRNIEDGLFGNLWNTIPRDSFLIRVNEFYKDTHFSSFYKQHEELYKSTVDLYKQQVLADLNTDWFYSFYGKKIETSYRIVLGMANGGGNYGLNVKYKGQPEIKYSVIGYYLRDNGKADFSKERPTLIHEFNHSFEGGVFFKADSLRAERYGMGLEKLAKYGMMRQAYSDAHTILAESIVRAAVIIYMMENNASEKEIQEEMMEQMKRDFRWMPELVSALRFYEQNRDKYKTLDDFGPGLLDALGGYLKREQERILKALK